MQLHFVGANVHFQITNSQIQMSKPQHTVLIVEDNVTKAMELEHQLRSWGYLPLKTAATAADAIQRAKSEHPQLILMDIRLRGELNGIDAARSIRQNGGQMPIVFVTSHRDQFLQAASEIGFFAFLDKPTDDRIVKETVRTALEHYQFQQDLLAVESLTYAGRMAIGFAHTLGNLLAPLAMISKPILAKLALKSDAELSRVYEGLQSHLEEGTAILKQLCLLAGGKEQKTDFEGCELLKKLARSVDHLFSDKFELRVACPDKPVWLHGNPTALQVAFMDLIFNANRAMPEQGILSLALETTELDDALSKSIDPSMPIGRYVRFRITDNGNGIPPERLATLYERGTSGSTSGMASGLGLWFLKEIVTSNGGYLPLPQTEVGKGTEFSVYFPVLALSTDSTVDRVAIAAPSLELRGNGQLVLFIEDEVLLRELTVAQLRVNNYEVLSTGAAGEALELANRHGARISAVISDVHLPGGMEPHWIENLRQLLPKAKLIICSGSSGQHETAHVHDAFLQKPYILSALLAVLRAKLLE